MSPNVCAVRPGTLALNLAWYGSEVSRGPITLAAFAALTLSTWLARPACAAVVEPRNEIEAHQVDGAADETPEATSEQPAITPDWKGLRRDTLYFLGYQTVVVAVLYALPESETNFNKSSAGLSKWWDNVSNPHRDTDDAYLNWITHPYWGAAYYIRGRERGLSRWQSFGYSALLSTLYEYGAEAFSRSRPTGPLDHAVIGSLLGNSSSRPARVHQSQASGPDGMDKFYWSSPTLWRGNELTDRLFGLETQVSLVPMGATRLSRSPTWPLATTISPGSRVAWPHPDSGRLTGVTWGLQLQVRW